MDVQDTGPGNPSFILGDRRLGDTALLYLLQRPVGMFSLLAANAGKKAFGLVLVVIYGDIISME